MKQSPFQNRDLTKKLLFPVLSWSSYSAWHYIDRHTTKEQAHEKWYERYVLGIPMPETPAILAGKIIGERLATDPTYLPEVPRPEIYEYEVLKQKFSGITLTGHMDGWSPATMTLEEYKTSQSGTYWNQVSVDTHGQLTFYALLHMLESKIAPEQIRMRLTYIPVVMRGDFTVERSKEPVQTFETKRTMLDVLRFGAELKKTYKEMELFVKKKQDEVFITI